jgi:hypothetical protein
MSAITDTTVVGVFTNQREAQEAIREIKRRGIREDQIGVISRADNRGTNSDPSAGDGTLAAEGAALGAAAGAGVGALWALGIAAGALPAVGPVIAGGTLAAVAASAAGGAVTAGLIGALVGLGIPESEARFYESEVKSGRTLITVRSPARPNEVAEILRAHGGYDVHNQAMDLTPLQPPLQPR